MISTYYGAWDYWELYQKVTFDPELRLIYVNPDVAVLDIRTEVYSAWKNWYKLADNSGLAPPALRSIGGDDTVGAEKAGDIYFLINNWRVVYDPRKVQVTGVLFSDDYDTPWLNDPGTDFMSGDDLDPVYPAKVASLVNAIKVQDGFPSATEVAAAVWDKPAIESVVPGSHGSISRRAAFGEHVHLNTNDGTAGTTYPQGTHGAPVNNFADAIAICAAEGINSIVLAEDGVIGATDNVSGLTIIGSHGVKSQITVTAGATTELTQFFNCQLTGVLNGRVVVRDSVIDDITGFEGILHQTVIQGSVAFAAGNNKSFILNCYSGVPGTGAPEFDLDLLTQGLAFRAYTGGIKLTNVVNNNNITVDFISGQLIMNGTVTTGTVVVRGIYHLSDTSPITPIQNTNLDTIEFKVDAVQTDVDAIQVDITNIGTVIDELIKYQKNRTVIDPVAFTMTIFDNDGITPLHVFDLKDQNGVASVESIFERIPV
jgi:hypothetical protein